MRPNERIWNVIFRGIPIRIHARDGDDLSGSSIGEFFVGNNNVFSFSPFTGVGGKLEHVQECAREVLALSKIDWDAVLGDQPGLINDSECVIRAAAFASRKHSTQRRKDADASPYINHPLAVSDILAREGGVTDRTVLAAALLHDTIEDTETTFEELCNEFGVEVAVIVRDVTDNKGLPKEERKRLQIEHAPHKSPGAKLVKLGDKIGNLRDIVGNPPQGWSVDRKLEYLHWAKEVVDGMRGSNKRLEQLFDQEFAFGIVQLEAALEFGRTPKGVST